MKTEQGLLHNRAIAMSMLVSCTVAAVWAWVHINTATQQPLDATATQQSTNAVEVSFFVLVGFIGASIAYRSRLWTDRVVFGAIAAGLGLAILRRVSPPSIIVILAIAKAAMWSIAACASLVAVTLTRRR